MFVVLGINFYSLRISYNVIWSYSLLLNSSQIHLLQPHFSTYQTLSSFVFSFLKQYFPLRILYDAVLIKMYFLHSFLFFPLLSHILSFQPIIPQPLANWEPLFLCLLLSKPLSGKVLLSSWDRTLNCLGSLVSTLPGIQYVFDSTKVHGIAGAGQWPLTRPSSKLHPSPSSLERPWS